MIDYDDRYAEHVERLARWDIGENVPAYVDTAEIVRQNSTRYVKQAPLGMMLTRNDGFRMIGGAR